MSNRLYDLWNRIENRLMRSTYRGLSDKRENEIRKMQDNVADQYYKDGELIRARQVEDQLEVITKLLKCKPDEIDTKINKILKHIEELEAEKKSLAISK
jgi:hypothetical protein